MADSMARIHPTSILRETPGAQEELPTAALSIANGGLIATDPQESSGTKALERIFVFDMELPPDAPPSAFGERVYVRFSHTFEPLAVQGWRRLRQLFLSRLTT
jgi:putative peptide zinc metalloprotease protein